MATPIHKEQKQPMARQVPTNAQTDRYQWQEPTYDKSEVWVVWLLWLLPILATAVTIILMIVKFLGNGGPAGLDLMHPLGH